MAIGGKRRIEFVTHFIMLVIGLELEYGAVLNCSLWTTTGYFWNIPLVSSQVAWASVWTTVPPRSIVRSIAFFTRRQEKCPSILASKAAL